MTNSSTNNDLWERYRQPAGLLLVGANAVFLAMALFGLLVAAGDNLDAMLGGLGSQFGAFVGLVPLAFPLAAVWCVTSPFATTRATAVIVAALLEYLISAVFGVVCLLADVARLGDITTASLTNIFTLTVSRLVWLVLLAAAAFAAIRLSRRAGSVG